MKTLDINKIAELLYKKPATIRNDLKRRPHAIPPKLNIPGKLLWLEADVEEWLEQKRQKKKGKAAYREIMYPISIE